MHFVPGYSWGYPKWLSASLKPFQQIINPRRMLGTPGLKLISSNFRRPRLIIGIWVGAVLSSWALMSELWTVNHFLLRTEEFFIGKSIHNIQRKNSTCEFSCNKQLNTNIGKLITSSCHRGLWPNPNTLDTATDLHWNLLQGQEKWWWNKKWICSLFGPN